MSGQPVVMLTTWVVLLDAGGRAGVVERWGSPVVQVSQTDRHTLAVQDDPVNRRLAARSAGASFSTEWVMSFPTSWKVV